MELLNLRDASLKYRKPVEIETALAYSAVKKFLDENEKSELFSYISDIVVTEKNINIYVTKAIARSEFILFWENFSKKILENLEKTYDSHERQVKIL